MKTESLPVWAAAALLTLPATCAAQYRNSATGQTYNNSYSAMLSVTNTMTQNFTTMQRQYLGSVSKATSASGLGNTPIRPVTPKYAITTTDFRASADRIFERAQADAPGITAEQKEQTRILCRQFLAQYETSNRKDNLAAAIAYAVRISLAIENRRVLSPDETIWNIQAFNDTFASSPVLYSMTPADKQLLYESSIITTGVAAMLYLQGSQQQNGDLQLQAKQIARAVLQRWAPNML